MSGKATYTNKITGETYQLGFMINDEETELSKSWDLVNFVANRNGWHASDIAVKSGE